MNRPIVSLYAVTHGVRSTRSFSPLPSDPLRRFKTISQTLKAPRVLITGSLGQLGRGLNSVFKYMYGSECVVMSDIIRLPADATDVSDYHYLNILSSESIEEIVVNKNIDTIVHFSALLSAVGEMNVPLALQVNCRGVENVLQIAQKHKLKVFIPSTIGAFGPTTQRENTPDITVQCPTTIYGVSKVYAERLGEYFHHRFGVDFRSMRFPGIISATQPGGGTTDYAIKIFYDALEKGRHTCYLRPDTRLPMMYDTDCMASVVQLLAADSSTLSQRTYNVTGFSFTPEEIAQAIRNVMPTFEISYDICPTRQAIADSWPKSLNDMKAREDWGWNPEYGLEETVQVMFALLQREDDKFKKSVTVA